MAAIIRTHLLVQPADQGAQDGAAVGGHLVRTVFDQPRPSQRRPRRATRKRLNKKIRRRTDVVGLFPRPRHEARIRVVDCGPHQLEPLARSPGALGAATPSANARCPTSAAGVPRRAGQRGVRSQLCRCAWDVPSPVAWMGSTAVHGQTNDQDPQSLRRTTPGGVRLAASRPSGGNQRCRQTAGRGSSSHRRRGPVFHGLHAAEVRATLSLIADNDASAASSLLSVGTEISDEGVG
jgi:hypothetical protein